MFAYKGVLYAGKYYPKPKIHKIKLKQLLNDKRKIEIKIRRVEALIDKHNPHYPPLL